MPTYATLKDGTKIQITEEQAFQLESGKPIQFQDTTVREAAKGATAAQFDPKMRPEDRAAMEAELRQVNPGLVNPAERASALQGAREEFTAPPKRPLGERLSDTGELLKFAAANIIPSVVGAGAGVTANALIRSAGKIPALARLLSAGAGGFTGEKINQELGLTEPSTGAALTSGGISALGQALSPRKLPQPKATPTSKRVAQSELLGTSKQHLADFEELKAMVKAGPDVGSDKFAPILDDLRIKFRTSSAPLDAKHAKVLESINAIANNLAPVTRQGHPIRIMVNPANAMDDITRLGALGNDLFAYDKELAKRVTEATSGLAEQVANLTKARKTFARGQRFGEASALASQRDDPYTVLKQKLSQPKFAGGLTDADKAAILKAGREASNIGEIAAMLIDNPVGRQFLKAGISPTGAISQGMWNLGLQFMRAREPQPRKAAETQ